jgi:ABC-type dipeptide/oligopeptide/nickel transport system permease component
VLIAVLVFFVITLLIFFAVNWNPPVYSFPPSATLDDIRGFFHERGLDQPKIIRYFNWLGDYFTGDWGNSFMHQMPVRDMLF